MSPTLPKPPSMAEIAASQGNAIDSRYHPSAAVRRQLNKVFPTHWSFLLGEIALYSFIVLLLTGVYLSLFFDPSMAEIVYDGVYQPLRGIEMSKAYASTLDISFEVRGGLFVRQVHHWAALLFAASIMVHLARIFFTGAFRRPREVELGHRLPAPDPGDVRGLLRLLTARRSALRHRPAGGPELHHPWHAGDRHVAALGAVRRRLPVRRRRIPVRAGRLLAPANVLTAHPVDPGDHPGAHRNSPRLAVVPEAHPVPRPRAHRDERRRCAGHAGVRGQVRRVLRDDHRDPGPDGRLATDQPDLAIGSVQTITCVGRQPAGLLHDVDRRSGAYLPGLGVVLPRPHRACGGVGGADHGPGLHAAARLAVAGAESSPATTPTTICCSVPEMHRCAPQSAPWRSRSTWC